MKTHNFLLLPGGCVIEVASFLLPQEAYNVCLTSKHFHSNSTPLSATILKSSLMSNLARVLKYNTKGITLENFATVQKLLVQHGLAKKSFYLSGSTVVQACLGVLWDRGHNAKTDVDIFCTHNAAPIIRSWLVNKNAGGPGHHIFSGAKFGSLDQSHFLVQESPINHVERYGLFTSIVQPTVGTVSTDQQQLHIQNEESVKTAIQIGMAKQTRHTAMTQFLSFLKTPLKTSTAWSKMMEFTSRTLWTLW